MEQYEEQYVHYRSKHTTHLMKGAKMRVTVVQRWRSRTYVLGLYHLYCTTHLEIMYRPTLESVVIRESF